MYRDFIAKELKKSEKSSIPMGEHLEISHIPWSPLPSSKIEAPPEVSDLDVLYNTIHRDIDETRLINICRRRSTPRVYVLVELCYETLGSFLINSDNQPEGRIYYSEHLEHLIAEGLSQADRDQIARDLSQRCVW
jgi:hypothetical protein